MQALKGEGNRAYANAKYEEAERHYTKALSLCERENWTKSVDLLYSNRYGYGRVCLTLLVHITIVQAALLPILNSQLLEQCKDALTTKNCSYTLATRS